ncbi:unnamed protein product [Closterium sp. Yama58-4]|nr:unnamed protein product [Closterium sp. Yama58-4]
MSSGRPRATSSACADLPPLPSASLALFSKTPALSPPRPPHALRSRAARVAISALAAVAVTLTALCLFRGSSSAPISPPASAASAHLPLAGEQPASPSARGSPPRFILYRMIGNDMPPLQCDGQLYLNTLYALQHEPKDLPELRRVWVMNKMLNDSEEARITAAILAHGYPEEDIVRIPVNYTELAAMPENLWSTAITAMNEARLVMMNHGIANGARWILPLDGNHFLTREVWTYLAAAADRHEAHGKTAFKIPVVKIDGPQSPEWINGSTLYSDLFPHAPTLQEGMIGFRNDSPHRYQPGMGFGRRNKLEAINRICGTGDQYTFLELTHKLGLLQLFYPDFTPQLADTGECGCQRETGSEAKTRPMRMSVLYSCGLSIRLWYYPCPEVDGARIMRDGWYRFKQRQKARFILLDRIRERIKQFTAERSG